MFYLNGKNKKIELFGNGKLVRNDVTSLTFLAYSVLHLNSNKHIFGKDQLVAAALLL